MPNRMGHKRGNPGATCKVCNHPGKEEVNTLLLNSRPHQEIIKKMARAYPDEPVLIPANLSRHYHNHVVNNPIVVHNEDGSETQYITGATRANAIVIAKEAIPDMVPIQDALKVIIAAGVSNIIDDPKSVTPNVLVMALQELKKLGGSIAGDEMAQAWAAAKKTKRTRKVTMEETVEETDEPKQLTDSVDAEFTVVADEPPKTYADEVTDAEEEEWGYIEPVEGGEL